MKLCNKCGLRKFFKKFYKDKSKKDGFHTICIDCSKETSKKYRVTEKSMLLNKMRLEKWKKLNPDRYATSNKEWKKKNSEKVSTSVKNWNKRNPDKVYAASSLRYKVRIGEIKKQSCEVCGNKIVDAHHDDYRKPLNVRWLCRKHHKEHHKKGEHSETTSHPKASKAGESNQEASDRRS